MDVTHTIDIVDELRLRRWAREHYVSSADRDAAWHPIILEEMQIRDRELFAPLVVDTVATAMSVV